MAPFKAWLVFQTEINADLRILFAMANRISAPVAVFGMVAFGTSCSLLAKLVYSVEAPTRFGGEARFEKPWFQVLAMFLGMSMCIVLDLPKRRQTVTDPEARPLISNGHASPAVAEESPPSVWIISLPTLLDLFATGCGTTGLLYTTVSVYQMLRGAMLVWTALLSVLFLGRRLNRQHLLGIALCISGIALVGVANIASEGAGAARQNVVMGIGIILVGQILQAGQVVMEEFLLKNMRISSIRIVAWEGLFGVAHCLLWVFPLIMLLPGRDHGRMEDVLDAFYMIAHSWKIAAVVGADMILMLGYNVCGMEVTEHLSAVHRVVIETLRTLCVWLADLVIYYLISNGRLGEKWTIYSFLQLAGFALLIAGTICYNFEHIMRDFHAKRNAASAMSENGISSVVALMTPTDTSEHYTPKSSTRTPRGAIEMDVDDGSDYEEDDDGTETGSFLGHAVGSASHSSYMVVGTPSSCSGHGGLLSSSPRLRSTPSLRSPRN